MKKLILFALLATSKVLASSELYQGSDEIKEVLKQNNMYEPNYVSLFFGLFLVIGLIYLTGIIYQKLTKIKLSQNNEETNKIQIISSANLGQNKALHVIKINDEYTLIGATQNNISYIKDIKQNENKEQND